MGTIRDQSHAKRLQRLSGSSIKHMIEVFASPRAEAKTQSKSATNFGTLKSNLPQHTLKLVNNVARDTQAVDAPRLRCLVT